MIDPVIIAPPQAVPSDSWNYSRTMQFGVDEAQGNLMIDTSYHLMR